MIFQWKVFCILLFCLLWPVLLHTTYANGWIDSTSSNFQTKNGGHHLRFLFANEIVKNGWNYRIDTKFNNKNIGKVYIALISSMILGRIVKCIVQFFILGFTDEGFVFSAFISGAFINAVPGIILQLILIPLVIFILNKTRFKNLMN